MLTKEQRRKILEGVFSENQRQPSLNETQVQTLNDAAQVENTQEQKAQCQEEKPLPTLPNRGEGNFAPSSCQEEEKPVSTLPIATKKLTAEQRRKILNSVFNVEVEEEKKTALSVVQEVQGNVEEEKPVINLPMVEETQEQSLDAAAQYHEEEKPMDEEVGGVDIEEPLSLLPVEIKTAPIGDCAKCPYKKARGTQSAKCGDLCAESLSYFEWCHNQVYYNGVGTLLYRIGMSPYLDHLKIGYDKATREIIIPLNKAQYVAVPLTKGGDAIADEETARRIFSHYHLQPRKNGEMDMRRNVEGKAEILWRNDDKPYLDSCFNGINGETVIAEMTIN